MAKAKKAEEEGGESAPLWIISFADMISLLMAFFVMLSSFTSYDKSEEKKLRAAIKATLAYAGGWKKFEPLWDLIIRSRRVAQMLPWLECILGGFEPSRGEPSSLGALET